MLKIDLHVHTWYSDARSSVVDVLDMAKKKGLDGIAITDHHTMQGVLDAKAQVDDFIIVPGIEITTRDGHLLGIGLRDETFTSLKTRNQSAAYVSQMIRALGGLVIIPHPCTPFFSMKRSVIERISPDAIEVYNAHSPCFARDARKSRELAKHLSLPMVAGSDSHTWQTVGDAYTLIDAPADIEAILYAIRLGYTSIVGKASPWKYRLPILTRRKNLKSRGIIQRQVAAPSTSTG
jgi:predicted metal-dependent phosphoesterase TrpH